MQSFEVLILFSLFLSIASSPTCPDESIIDGCGCRQKRALDSLPDLLCKSKDVNVDQVIRNLNKHYGEQVVHFGELYWENGNKVALDDHFFGNITFRKVMIGTPQQYTYVSHVSPKAFHGPIADELQWLAIRSYELIGEKDLFEAIATLPKLEYLAIEGRYLVSVPPNAFQAVLNDSDSDDHRKIRSGFTSKLKRINFTEGHHETFIFLTRIEEKAFYNLPALEEINMMHQDVYYIADYAFACPNPVSSKKLVINLSLQWNRNLKPESFSRYSLADINRPVELNLYGNQFISYLPEDVFGSFFEANEQNKVKLGMKMNCSCEMFWLYAQPERYRPHFIEWSFQDNLEDNDTHLIQCQDGGELWQMESKQFEHCILHHTINNNMRVEL